MYTIEEYDNAKSKVLKYILYKKRSKQEVKNKFYNSIEEEMLNNIIDESVEIRVNLWRILSISFLREEELQVLSVLWRQDV